MAKRPFRNFYPFGNGHPSFFGWVNSPPAVMSVFAEALAAAIARTALGDLGDELDLDA
ncbi:MAG: hypothetical protein AABM32_04745 [Chloroflexota bacterium]